MPPFLIKLIVTAVSMMITAYIIPGIFISNITAALIASLVFGIINTIVKPILILFTLPATIFSLGLFLFVINAICFSLAAYFVPGVSINSFWDALLGSIVLSLISSFLNNQL